MFKFDDLLFMDSLVYGHIDPVKPYEEIRNRNLKQMHSVQY